MTALFLICIAGALINFWIFICTLMDLKELMDGEWDEDDFVNPQAIVHWKSFGYCILFTSAAYILSFWAVPGGCC